MFVDTFPDVGIPDHRQHYDEWVQQDFMTEYSPVTAGFDLVMGNPPFSLAEKGWLAKCLNLMTPNGLCVLLLRSSFLHGQHRYVIHVAHRPRRVTHLSKRPSFGKNKLGKRGTDMVDYTIFEWAKTPALRTDTEWRF